MLELFDLSGGQGASDDVSPALSKLDETVGEKTGRPTQVIYGLSRHGIRRRV